MKRKSDNQTDKKRSMLSALEKTKGIVTVAAKKVGISRDTHYRWLKEDSGYHDSVDEIANVALDFVESKLLDRIEGAILRP